MNHCKNCKHWEEGGDPREGITRQSRLIGAGVCLRIKPLFESEEWAEIESDEVIDDWMEVTHKFRESSKSGDMAWAQDGEEYMAGLITAPEFGCVMFEAGETRTLLENGDILVTSNETKPGVSWSGSAEEAVAMFCPDAPADEVKELTKSVVALPTGDVEFYVIPSTEPVDFSGSANKSFFNWSQHQFEPIKCIFKPRPEYNGNAIKPGLEALIGKELVLRTMWLMGEDDPYPGEFALEGVDDENRQLYYQFGVSWIASGDVEVIR